MIDEKPINPEKEQRQLLTNAQRIHEIADKVEKLNGTTIPNERRLLLESQVDKLEDVLWLLSK